jgi:hypothetical protein
MNWNDGTKPTPYSPWPRPATVSLRRDHSLGDPRACSACSHGSHLMTDAPRPTRAPAHRCGAKTRKGTSCIRKALRNGRCPNHGGLSTGPKRAEGRARIAIAQRQRREHMRSNSCDSAGTTRPIRARVMGSSPADGVFATRPPRGCGCAPETISDAVHACAPARVMGF